MTSTLLLLAPFRKVLNLYIHILPCFFNYYGNIDIPAGQVIGGRVVYEDINSITSTLALRLVFEPHSWQAHWTTMKVD